MKKASTLLILNILFLAFPVSADEPSVDELKNALAFEIPGHIAVDEFVIDAEQNLGNEVEPLYLTRFRVIVKLKADTYVVDNSVKEITFLVKKKEKGDKVELFGKSASRIYAGKWQTDFKLEGSPIQNFGKPLSAFSGRLIVRGSEEEKEYLRPWTLVSEFSYIPNKPKWSSWTITVPKEDTYRLRCTAGYKQWTSDTATTGRHTYIPCEGRPQWNSAPRADTRFASGAQLVKINGLIDTPQQEVRLIGGKLEIQVLPNVSLAHTGKYGDIEENFTRNKGTVKLILEKR